MVKVGAIDIPPFRIAIAILDFVVFLLALSICVYGVWFILSDWSHIAFTRCVVLLACIWFGALMLAVIADKIRIWRRVLFSHP
jgi:hypothetical protein